MDAPTFDGLRAPPAPIVRGMSHPPPAPPDGSAIQAALDVLEGLDVALAMTRRLVPAPAWRVRDGGFGGLLRILIGQQLSVRAAASIWGRLDATLNPVTAEGLMELSDQDLRGLGFSASKIRHSRALAAASLSGALDFEAVGRLPHEDAVAALCAHAGVGPWTAEVYLMVCEGRIDAFPAGDVALQEALRLADSAETRPSAEALLARAEGWRPYRGVAAHLLWSFYGAVRRNEIDQSALVRCA